jgi:hypothetical protein
MWIQFWIVSSARLYTYGISAFTQFVKIHQYICIDTYYRNLYREMYFMKRFCCSVKDTMYWRLTNELILPSSHGLSQTVFDKALSSCYSTTSLFAHVLQLILPSSHGLSQTVFDKALSSCYSTTSLFVHVLQLILPSSHTASVRQFLTKH